MLYPFELRAHEHEFNTVKRAYCETRAALARLAESRKRRYLEGNWTVTLSPMGSDFASSLENEIVTSRTLSIFSAGSSVNTLFFPVTVEILCTSPLEHGPSAVTSGTGNCFAMFVSAPSPITGICEHAYVLPLAAERDLGCQFVLFSNSAAASAAGNGFEK